MTVACQAALSMGFPRKNTRVGHQFLFQGNFPGIEFMSPALTGGFFTTEHLEAHNLDCRGPTGNSSVKSRDVLHIL